MSKVISRKNFPSRLPLVGTVVVYLYMDRYSHPGWFAGVVWTFIVLGWIASIIAIIKEEQVDVIDPAKKEKKTWAQRLEEIQNRRS